MHKLTTIIARELGKANSGAILKNLRNIKSGVLNRSKHMSRKLGEMQDPLKFMLEYKLK